MFGVNDQAPPPRRSSLRGARQRSWLTDRHVLDTWSQTRGTMHCCLNVLTVRHAYQITSRAGIAKYRQAANSLNTHNSHYGLRRFASMWYDSDRKATLKLL